MGPDLRIDTAITAVLTVAVLPVAMLPALGVVVRRYGRLHAWPLVCAVALLGSASALAAFTLFPLPEPGTLDCSTAGMTDRWVLDPFAQLTQVVHAVERRGILSALDGWMVRFAVLNVLLFVPFGLFLHQVARWRVGRIAFVSAGTSLAIELTQGTGVFGMYPCPYRTLDLGDVLLNTAGGTLGALASVLLARASFASPVPVPDLDPPTRTRRAVAVLADVVLVAGLTLASAATVQAVIARSATLERAQEVVGAPWIEITIDVLAAAAATLLPMLLTRDRATPGELLLNVAPARLGSADPPPAGRLIARWATRWLPWALVPALLPAILLAEMLVAVARRDGRSLSSVVSGTATLTRPALAAMRARRDAEEALQPEEA
ncbi:VanZ family protein [Demequina mangrovi]|uniref:RDD family protein n=1 Tax=Demequina mangrovi TaxID=1043493 RepID=A0A1H7AS91_9MICO|nr:VanZ family protein [Demequina mangrovi]SEJ66727.1 RDD family protein [Demequina mangrovi]